MNVHRAQPSGLNEGSTASDSLHRIDGASDSTAQQVAVMLLVDVAATSRLWGWARIALGARGLRGVPGLKFAKVLGSGYDGGFGLRPSASRQGLFALFHDEIAADAFVERSDVVTAYRLRSSEFCSIKLRAWSSRGSWDGERLSECVPAPMFGPVVALTRASIRLSRATTFWRRAPGTQAALASARGCMLAVGLGEAPILRQATFSVWESVQAMDAYARSGPHLDAIRAAKRDGYFSESMFVRFTSIAIRGSWKGHCYD